MVLESRPNSLGPGSSWSASTIRLKAVVLVRKHWLEVIYILVGIHFVVRRMWFLDEAFVYLRYADNWVLHGLGLTYNAGEFVEGYTSPAWLFLLAFFRLLGANYWSLVFAIAVFSVIVFSLLIIRVNDALSPGQNLRLNFPLAYLCANYGVSKYFSSALETPLVLICAAGIGLFAVRPKSRVALVVTALAPMVRHELIIAVVFVGVLAWVKERKFPKMLALLTGIPLFAWIFFRVYYYADFFPNTYHLKDTVNLTRGLAYLFDTCTTYKLQFVLLAFVGLAIVAKAKAHFGARLALMLGALGIGAYVVKVGGDYNHFRMLAPAFVLAVLACGGLIEDLLGRFGKVQAPATVVLALGIVFCVARIDVAQQAGVFGNVERHWRQKRSLRPQNIRRADAQAQRYGKGPQERVFVDGWCLLGFRLSNTMMINRFGLTDGILSRVDGLRYKVAGHAWEMVSPAMDLMALYTQPFAQGPLKDRFKPRRIRHPGKVGRIRYAIQTNRAAPWIHNNLEALEVMERKIYNRHRFWENLQLAFKHPRVRYDRSGSWCQGRQLSEKQRLDCRR